MDSLCLPGVHLVMSVSFAAVPVFPGSSRITRYRMYRLGNRPRAHEDRRLWKLSDPIGHVYRSVCTTVTIVKAFRHPGS